MAPVFTYESPGRQTYSFFCRGVLNGRFIKVGVITTTHGVRGEVKVFPTTDPERFLDLEYVILDAGREMKKLEIRNVKFF